MEGAVLSPEILFRRSYDLLDEWRDITLGQMRNSPYRAVGESVLNVVRANACLERVFRFILRFFPAIPTMGMSIDTYLKETWRTFGLQPQLARSRLSDPCSNEGRGSNARGVHPTERWVSLVRNFEYAT